MIEMTKDVRAVNNSAPSVAEIKLQTRPDHNCQAPPVRLRRQIRDLVAILPGDISRNDRHEKTVPHIFVVVPLDWPACREQARSRWPAAPTPTQ